MIKLILCTTLVLSLAHHVGRAQVIVNPDGSHSVVAGNVIVNPDGSHSVIVGNVIVNPNGTHSVIVGNVLVNPDGSHSAIPEAVKLADAIKRKSVPSDSVSLRKLIIQQSKEGGKLDYFTKIKGKETNGSQIKPGIYAQNIHIAWFYWGKANYVNGVKSLDEVISIFKEWKEREPGRMELEHIKLGFADRDKKD